MNTSQKCLRDEIIVDNFAGGGGGTPTLFDLMGVAT